MCLIPALKSLRQEDHKFDSSLRERRREGVWREGEKEERGGMGREKKRRRRKGEKRERKTKEGRKRRKERRKGRNIINPLANVFQREWFEIKRTLARKKMVM
jgi:hypothetical protein